MCLLIPRLYHIVSPQRLDKRAITRQCWRLFLKVLRRGGDACPSAWPPPRRTPERSRCDAQSAGGGVDVTKMTTPSDADFTGQLLSEKRKKKLHRRRCRAGIDDVLASMPLHCWCWWCWWWNWRQISTLKSVSCSALITLSSHASPHLHPSFNASLVCSSSSSSSSWPLISLNGLLSPFNSHTPDVNYLAVYRKVFTLHFSTCQSLSN